MAEIETKVNRTSLNNELTQFAV